MDKDAGSPLAQRAHDMANEALARISTLERLTEERQRDAGRRHEETRQLIIDLKGSFRENFGALQANIAEAVDQFRRQLDDHKTDDDKRFGIISNRSWSAMWALNGVLLTVVLGLATAIWRMSGHG